MAQARIQEQERKQEQEQGQGQGQERRKWWSALLFKRDAAERGELI